MISILSLHTYPPLRRPRRVRNCPGLGRQPSEHVPVPGVCPLALRQGVDGALLHRHGHDTWHDHGDLPRRIKSTSVLPSMGACRSRESHRSGLIHYLTTFPTDDPGVKAGNHVGCVGCQVRAALQVK